METHGLLVGGAGDAPPAGAGLAGAVDVAEGLSALPSQLDLAAVCDIDVDAIGAWELWRALQPDVLVLAAARALLDVIHAAQHSYAVPVAAPPYKSGFEALMTRYALEMVRTPDCPGLEGLALPLVSELPKGTS